MRSASAFSSLRDFLEHAIRNRANSPFPESQSIGKQGALAKNTIFARAGSIQFFSRVSRKRDAAKRRDLRRHRRTPYGCRRFLPLRAPFKGRALPFPCAHPNGCAMQTTKSLYRAGIRTRMRKNKRSCLITSAGVSIKPCGASFLR